MLSRTVREWIMTDVLDLVAKVYTLCRVKTIRIVMSTVMDRKAM